MDDAGDEDDSDDGDNVMESFVVFDEPAMYHRASNPLCYGALCMRRRRRKSAIPMRGVVA